MSVQRNIVVECLALDLRGLPAGVVPTQWRIPRPRALAK